MSHTASGDPNILGALLSPAIVRALRDLVRTEVASTLGARSDDWLAHPSWPFGGRRRNAELARSGRIEGVRREGKVWLARRSALDAYIATLPGAPMPCAANDTAADPIDREIDRLVADREARR